MDTRNEIREFLTSRRAKLKAADVGLPDYGTRRVPGLRREEVAVLAGVSVPYYTRLERGDLAGASDSVLDALARALQLDYERLEAVFDSGLTIFAYTADSGTRSAEALGLLGSLAATAAAETATPAP